LSNRCQKRIANAVCGHEIHVTVGEGSLTTRRPQVVLSLTGELDVATATAAHKRLINVDLRAGDELVLDLSGLTFMDSTGIRLILQAREHALQCGAAFALTRGPEAVMRVLHLVGLDDQLEFVDPT
jgi:anti-sigma B factor antagonist